jgi:hypothetical protein
VAGDGVWRKIHQIVVENPPAAGGICRVCQVHPVGAGSAAGVCGLEAFWGLDRGADFAHDD